MGIYNVTFDKTPLSIRSVRCHNKSKLFLLYVVITLTIGFIQTISNVCSAADAQNITLSTDQNVAIDILLNSNRITTTGNVIVSIPQTPTNGTATVNGLIITYKPNEIFFGQDSFVYSVQDDTSTASATITITVGKVTQSNSSSVKSPESEVEDAIDVICGNNQDQGIQDICTEFNSGTAQEKNDFLREVAPVNVAAQSRVNTNIMIQQLGNITRRLSALRSGVRGTALGDLSLRIDDTPVSLAQLASLFGPNLNGGGASGDRAKPSRLGIFTSGNIGLGDRKKTSQEDGFDFSNYGLTIGADYKIGNKFIVGGAAGYSYTGLNLADKGGDLSVGGSNFLGYSTFFSSVKSYLDLILTVNVNGYNSSRNIDFTINNVPTNETAKGNTSSLMYAASFGGGYEIVSIKGFTSSVLGRLNYLYSTIDGYSEKGAPGLNLTIHDREVESSTFTLGGQFNYVMSFSKGVIIPQMDFSWEHELLANATLVKASFVEDLSETLFSFKTDAPDKDYFRIGFGSSVVFAGGATAFIQYETVLGQNNASEHTISVGGRMEL